ncbi:MAG: MurR/RpiR family transcriptional regulator [Pyrinomonadaceae bacterium]|nr:MurR/RpiR family transcriptional regulator [Pyrinomonadaceae bacterium]MBA3569519.1 MurR/RpiR family transcriptional regulator [Pyrinomonadaceae bacterium]
MNRSNSRKKRRSSSNGSDSTDGKSSALEVRFAQAQSDLNPHRQRLVRAILDSADETCFLSSRELAKRYRVDATTILRATQVLGYESFAEFSTDLRQHFVTRMTPYTALKAATREKRSVADHIDHALDKALDNINALKADLDSQRIIELAKLIKRSRRILVVGVDFAASLANCLAYGLLGLGFDAGAPIGGTGNLQHKVEVLTSKDVLVAISFGQCLRDTVEAVLQARKQGVPTFGITDSDTTPIARYCDAHVVASVVSPSFLNSYVAPTAVINAIHVACAHIDPKRALTRLRPTDREYASGPRWYRELKGSNGDSP